MPKDYSHNHYVPEWYQKRFLLGQSKFFYLDLAPEVVTRGPHTYTRKAMLRWGPPSCFAQDDLYTTQWAGLKNTDIEQFFFGALDTRGRAALEFFNDYSIRNGLHEAFENLLRYMSAQKLRTPKGIAYLSMLLGLRAKNHLLIALQQLHTMHCAIWTDAVWQIAEATQSSTKFIISDHPVTVYNRGCFPGSAVCRGGMEPDIRMVATQTLFPLSPDKILILTNLAWVRNPYQDPRKYGPNKRLFHTGMFMGTSLQRGRHLSEQEVREINYIIKRRAHRYIAAAEREWLYPEELLPSTHWSKFGNGYLLMPDPRDISMGGQIYVGYKDGTSEAWNEYGQRPWERGFEDAKRFERESATLHRFQAEFAALYGPTWRGWSEEFGNEGPRSDSPDMQEWRTKRP
jgi:hypothetical protein